MSRTHLGVVGPYSSRTGLHFGTWDWESAGDVTHLRSSVPAPKWRNRSHVTNYMPGWGTALLSKLRRLNSTFVSRVGSPLGPGVEEHCLTDL